ncbi:MAG: hypothetical protein ACK6A8_15550, partial [Planctomycetota bacterium]
MNRYGDKWVNARGTRVAVGYWSPQPLGLIAASLLCGLTVALVGNWAWGQDPELPAAEKVPSAEKAPATESAQDVDVEALLNKAA